MTGVDNLVTASGYVGASTPDIFYDLSLVAYREDSRPLPRTLFHINLVLTWRFFDGIMSSMLYSDPISIF